MTAQEYEQKVSILLDTTKLWMDNLKDKKFIDLETHVKNGDELHKKFDELLFHNDEKPEQATPWSDRIDKIARDFYFECFTNVLFPLRRALKEYNKAVMGVKLYKLSALWNMTEHK